MCGIGAREKYKREAAAVDHHFGDVRIVELGDVQDAPIQRGHRHRRIGRERCDHFVDRARIDERLVALDIDDNVAVERLHDFREAVGTGLVGELGQFDPSAEIVDTRRDAQIVGRDDHLRHCFRRFGASIHVLDHRPAVEIGERLARESSRRVPCGDDGDDGERRNRIDSRASRNRVHDE